MSVRENNYKWISTLRGFAALLVFTAHLPIPLPHVVNFAIGRTGVALFFLIMGVIILVLGIYVDLIVCIVGGAFELAIGLALGIYALVKRFAKVHLSDNEVETRILRQGVPEIE